MGWQTSLGPVQFVCKSAMADLVPGGPHLSEVTGKSGPRWSAYA